MDVQKVIFSTLDCACRLCCSKACGYNRAGSWRFLLISVAATIRCSIETALENLVLLC